MKKTVKNTVLLLLIFVATAHASLTIPAEETGLLMWAFIAFVGLILTFQLIPGLALFSGMIKGLFAGKGKAF